MGAEGGAEEEARRADSGGDGILFRLSCSLLRQQPLRDVRLARAGHPGTARGRGGGLDAAAGLRWLRFSEVLRSSLF